MCNEAVAENGGTLKSVPDCHKNHQICDKVVDNYLHALEFVPDCYITSKMCDKAVNTHPFTIEYVSVQFKAQEMYDKAVIIRCVFVFDSIPDWYKTKLKKCVTELFLYILL